MWNLKDELRTSLVIGALTLIFAIFGVIAGVKSGLYALALSNFTYFYLFTFLLLGDLLKKYDLSLIRHRYRTNKAYYCDSFKRAIIHYGRILLMCSVMQLVIYFLLGDDFKIHVLIYRNLVIYAAVLFCAGLKVMFKESKLRFKVALMIILWLVLYTLVGLSVNYLGGLNYFSLLESFDPLLFVLYVCLFISVLALVFILKTAKMEIKELFNFLIDPKIILLLSLVIVTSYFCFLFINGLGSFNDMEIAFFQDYNNMMLIRFDPLNINFKIVFILIFHLAFSYGLARFIDELSFMSMAAHKIGQRGLLKKSVIPVIVGLLQYYLVLYGLIILMSLFKGGLPQSMDAINLLIYIVKLYFINIICVLWCGLSNMVSENKAYYALVYSFILGFMIIDLIFKTHFISISTDFITNLKWSLFVCLMGAILTIFIIYRFIKRRELYR